MKRLKGFTRDELIQLTEDDINNLIDLECMYNGKPILVAEPKYLEVPEVPVADIKLYKVADFYFTDESEALKIKELIENSKSVTSPIYFPRNYDYLYITKEEYKPSVAIKNLDVYSYESYKKASDIASEKNKVVNINREIQDEYDEKIEGRKEIMEEVYTAVSEARKESENIKIAIAAYEKYLILSNNDNTTAMNFFANSEYKKYIDDVKCKFKID